MVRLLLALILVLLVGFAVWSGPAPLSGTEVSRDIASPGPTSDPGASLAPVAAEDARASDEPFVVEVAEFESAAASNGATPPEAGPQNAILYEHAAFDPAFPGKSWVVGPGLFNAGASFANDDVSSVEVPPGYMLVLFEDEDGEGPRTTVAEGRHNLKAYGFCDRASSVRLERARGAARTSGSSTFVLYEHGQVGTGIDGKSWTLNLSPGRDSTLFRAGPGTFDNDSVSSVEVPPYHELTLFDEPDGRGAAFVLGAGMHELEFIDWSDRVSSVRVARAQGH
ncbi:MAG: hypothetical protein AAGA20_12115 [Planctomycetota bacterium]